MVLWIIAGLLFVLVLATEVGRAILWVCLKVAVPLLLIAAWYIGSAFL